MTTAQFLSIWLLLFAINASAAVCAANLWAIQKLLKERR